MGESYQPNEGVLAKLPQITFVAVVGPTAVGKTTLMNAAAARCPALHPVVSTTTRKQRPDEENGVDLHFLPRSDVEARVAAREYATVVMNTTGELYATAPEDYSTDGIAMMPVLATALPVFKGLPFKAVRIVYILPPSWEVWQERVVSHGFNPDELEQRMVEAGQSLRYAIEAEDLVYVINDDLAQSTLDFTQAALGATAASNQYRSHDLAVTLLKELQNR